LDYQSTEFGRFDMKRIQYGKPKKCPVQHKTQFETEDMANRAMFRAWGHDPQMDIKDMHTYQCPACKTWHFGHISYFKAFQENNGKNLSQSA
jgi:hypothetical protein